MRFENFKSLAIPKIIEQKSVMRIQEVATNFDQTPIADISANLPVNANDCENPEAGKVSKTKRKKYVSLLTEIIRFEK